MMADAIAFLRIAEERGARLTVEDVMQAMECCKRNAYRWISVWHSFGGESTVKDRE